MSINPSHTNSISTQPELLDFSQEMPVILKDGRFILPNGLSYAVSKLKIRGKEIDLSQPLNQTQLKAIQTLTNHFLSQLSQEDLIKENLQSIAIKTTPQSEAMVTTHFQGEAIQTKLFEAQAVAVTQIFHTVFPLTSSPSLLPDEQLHINRPPISPATPHLKPVQSVAQQRLSSVNQIDEEDEELMEIPSEEGPLVHSHSRLSSLHDRAGNPTISHSYAIEGQEIGRQEIERISTVTQTIEFSEKMLASLALKLPEADPQEQDLIRSDILYYEQTLESAKAYVEKSDWIASSYFREHIEKSGSFDRAIRNYVPAAVNMRYQSLKIEGEQAVGFMRVSVISDMRNGWYSLTDLKKMKKTPELIESKLHELEKDLPTLQRKQLESALYAINQLKIMKNDLNSIDFFIRDRTRVLQQQMIQLVSEQVSRNPEKIKEAIQSEGSLDIVHVALLNQQLNIQDTTGWVHNERVEMEDMQEIFHEFQNKKLVFDGRGPLIDEEAIYLPPLFDELEDREITLKTFFFNTSVQGNTVNDGTQLRINQEEMLSLTEAHPDLKDVAEIKTILESRHTSYEIAEDFAKALLESNHFCLSIGCLSAKDRTGFVAERLMLAHLRPHLPAEKASYFDKKIFDPSGPAVKVVAENTPIFRVLKVNPLASLPSFNLFDKIKMIANLAMAQIRAIFAQL